MKQMERQCSPEIFYTFCKRERGRPMNKGKKSSGKFLLWSIRLVNLIIADYDKHHFSNMTNNTTNSNMKISLRPIKRLLEQLLYVAYIQRNRKQDSSFSMVISAMCGRCKVFSPP
jgi:hypothetical protein